MSSTAIQAAPRQAALTMNDELNFANMVAAGNLVPQQYQNNPANILIAVNLGSAMGLGPAESLYRINVIKGKPTASAELIAAQVRKAGHKLRIQKDEAAQSVTATIVRADDPKFPISETRDMAWAQQMGLAGNPNYKRQPMTMLTWRAITACAREACPEALYGVAYTPDEMDDMDAAPEPRQVRASVEPVAQAAPQPRRNSAEYMRPVRERFKAWAQARGLSMADAAATLARECGAPSMQEMTAAQASRAIDLMDGQIAAAKDEPAQAVEEADPAVSAVAAGGHVFVADRPQAEELEPEVVQAEVRRMMREESPQAYAQQALYDEDVKW